MNFVSYAKLARDVDAWLKALPRFETIVGIMRSGLFPAVMLAKHMGVSVVPYWKGARIAIDPQKTDALVVDDSLNFGGAMNSARVAIHGRNVKFAAVYVADEAGTKKVDFFYKILPKPRIFEWNLWSHDILADACLDMDGVICEDVPAGMNDDGPRYAEFLQNARPWHIPAVRIGAIVTGRLSKYRRETEEWLSRHGVKYGELAMMPFQKPEERRAYGIERFKAEKYIRNGHRLFIENDPRQALIISVKTQRPVLLTSPDEEWRII